MIDKCGKYQIKGKIGSGAMADVFLAIDPDLDMLVALKLMKTSKAIDENLVSRFLDEARTMGRLSHDNIVKPHHIGKCNNSNYIAMEFVTGTSLYNKLEGHDLNLLQKIEIGIQIANALDYMHSEKIYHRDIKPSNILITKKDNRVKITDFGISYKEKDIALMRTQEGMKLGTPSYMSPEQIASPSSVKGYSDIFSLGVVLYEMTTGKKPFVGDDFRSIANAIFNKEPTPPHKINSEIPRSLSALILKCLSKKKEDRIQSANKLALQLKKIMKRLKAPPNPYKKYSKIMAVAACILLISGLSYTIINHFENQRDTDNPITPEKPLLKLATLSVKSEPTGSEVLIDGDHKGTTPLELNLPLGTHKVRLKSPEGVPWDSDICLEGDNEFPLFISFP